MVSFGAFAFAVAWWLGLYLLARDPGRPVLRRTGVGLIAYALALATATLRTAVPAGTRADTLAAAERILVSVPALAWAGVVVLMLPAHAARADRAYRYALLPLAAVTVAGAVLDWRPLAWLPLVPLAAALALLVKGRGGGERGVLAVATLLFGLGAAALLLPAGWPPQTLWLAAIGLDLVILGLLVARWDAVSAGEALRADLVRSALASAATAVLFGGQVTVALALVGPVPALVGLLFGTVGAAVAVAVWAGPLQSLIDRWTLRPEVRGAAAELRAAAEALPRRAGGHPLAEVSEEEFVGYVRRALSHYGNLGRLLASPLTTLPEIAARLAARGAPDQPLERAAELKSLVLASILRLKPRDAEFATTEEWRHFNALYFPYVVGIRPYRRTANRDGLNPTARQAFDWLRRYVPERTLYNWQNAAARVVAADLRAALIR